MEGTRTAGARGRWAARLAGGLLVAVGAVNAALAVWDLVGPGQATGGLGVGQAGGLTVAGVLAVAAGVLVWRGSRPVTLVALAMFAVLLVLEAGALADPADTGNHTVPLVLLALIVAALGLAALRGRRSARRPAPAASASAGAPPDAGSGTG